MLVCVPRAFIYGAANAAPVSLDTGPKLPIARERRRRLIENDDVESAEPCLVQPEGFPHYTLYAVARARLTAVFL